MSIHLEYLTGSAFYQTAGIWGSFWAAQNAMRGGQSIIHVEWERAGWCGHE